MGSRRVAALVVALGAAWFPAQARSPQIVTATAKTVVQLRGYASLEPVPRARRFDLAVVAAVKPGYHLNAHTVRHPYLIPTELDADLPAGFRLEQISYPPGELLKLSFSPEKLLVYTGSVTLRARVAVSGDAPLGLQKLPLVVRYQACNERMCLPPVKLPVTVEVRVVPSGTPARPAHPEIFGSARSSR
jgi:hypothetical protein